MDGKAWHMAKHLKEKTPGSRWLKVSAVPVDSHWTQKQSWPKQVAYVASMWQQVEHFWRLFVSLTQDISIIFPWFLLLFVWCWQEALRDFRHLELPCSDLSFSSPCPIGWRRNMVAFSCPITEVLPCTSDLTSCRHLANDTDCDMAFHCVAVRKSRWKRYIHRVIWRYP